MGGTAKTERVFVRVTEWEHEWLRRKARACGIPMSRLVLLSVDAYVRRYGSSVAEGEIVAVNYGVWTRAASSLGSIDRTLRRLDLALARAARSLRGPSVLDPREARRASASIEASRTDMATMREDLERCVASLLAIAEVAHLVDPDLGKVPEGDDD